MRLLHVVPIAKGITKQELSYFTTKQTRSGELVFVPLRKRVVPAIVLESVRIENVKSRIKASTFAMKKVDAKEGKIFLLPEFIEASEKASSYFATTVGAVLHQVVPALLFEKVDVFPSPVIAPKGKESKLATEKLILETDENARISTYKSIVREEFARKNSVFISISSIREADAMEAELKKGIDEYVFVLHSEISKKELQRRIEHVLRTAHPVLIIATPSYLAVPRGDVGTIIVERESARSYKRQTRPYVNMRLFAEFYAEALGARIVFADLPLSMETHYKHKQREYDELKSVRTRIVTNADQFIVDMRSDTEGVAKFSAISDILLEHVKRTVDEGGHVFLFNVRRGIAPTTVCEECGNVVLCKKCERPVVLHKDRNRNVFLCHSCGEIRSAKERCQHCNSWRLKALGIGVERVKDELARHFDGKKIFSIDSDSTKTYKQASRTAEDFYKARGAVLVGTELALSFLKVPLDLSGIVSLDTLLSVPDARIHEHIFSLIIRIRARTEREFFLQTRQPELPVIRYATEGNISGFYEKEILMRRRFDYPPFSVLIKVSSFGAPKKAVAELEHVESFLKGYGFTIYPGFTPLRDGVFALHGLLRVPAYTWPEKDLVGLLRSLPPSISVNVAPTSTL